MSRTLLRLIGACGPEDMLWEWARAECQSSRFGKFYSCGPEMLARLRSGAAYDGSRELDRRIVAAVLRVRAPLLDGLAPARIAWHRAALRPAALADLRLIRDPELKRLSPRSARLADLAAALEADAPETRDVSLARAYRETAADFDVALMQGAPILLGQREAGPFSILEGYRRLATLCARHIAGKLADRDIPVIVGLWPDLPRWSRHHVRPRIGPRISL